MKTIFATLAAALVTLCTTSTALAETPVPASSDAPKVSVPGMPQFYYSETPEEDKAPEIILHAKKTVVEEEEDATLSMSCSGFPKPVVEVFFNRTLIKLPHFKYKLTSDGKQRYAFTILFAEPTDTGTYTFRVKNDLGIATTSAVLVVNVKYTPLLLELSQTSNK